MNLLILVLVLMIEILLRGINMKNTKFTTYVVIGKFKKNNKVCQGFEYKKKSDFKKSDKELIENDTYWYKMLKCTHTIEYSNV